MSNKRKRETEETYLESIQSSLDSFVDAPPHSRRWQPPPALFVKHANAVKQLLQTQKKREETRLNEEKMLLEQAGVATTTVSFDQKVTDSRSLQNDLLGHRSNFDHMLASTERTAIEYAFLFSRMLGEWSSDWKAYTKYLIGKKMGVSDTPTPPKQPYSDDNKNNNNDDPLQSIPPERLNLIRQTMGLLWHQNQQQYLLHERLEDASERASQLTSVQSVREKAQSVADLWNGFLLALRLFHHETSTSLMVLPVLLYVKRNRPKNTSGTDDLMGFGYVTRVTKGNLFNASDAHGTYEFQVHTVHVLERDSSGLVVVETDPLMNPYVIPVDKWFSIHHRPKSDDNQTKNQLMFQSKPEVQKVTTVTMQWSTRAQNYQSAMPHCLWTKNDKAKWKKVKSEAAAALKDLTTTNNSNSEEKPVKKPKSFTKPKWYMQPFQEHTYVRVSQLHDKLCRKPHLPIEIWENVLTFAQNCPVLIFSRLTSTNPLKHNALTTIETDQVKN